jgi:autotransporter-associated beta strand protein
LSAVRFEPGGNVRSWRVDFRVNRDITVTHLGAFDSGGDGFTSLKSVTIRPRAGGAALAALAFAAGAEYPLSGGYRFRHLPEPLRLTPGDYAIVAYGFTNTDGHKLAGHDGAGGVAGTTVDGGGAVAFLPTAYYVFNSPAGFPATAAGVPADSPYGAAGGSFRFVTDAAVKRVFGPLTLAAGRRLDIGATDVRLLGGVEAGAGAVLTNASAARAVSLTLGVPAGMTNEVAAAALGDRADGPVALVKSDAGTLRLTGALRTRGGVHVALGTLAVDSPAALGADGVSFGNSGRIEAYGSGAVGGVVYTPGQTQANWRTARFVAQPGAAVTFTGAFETTRLTEFGGFALQPSASAEDATIAVDGGRFGFLDLYLLGDGRPGGGRARHLWNNARGGLRKLACGHETVDGCDVVFGAGCDFTANWFDMAGSNAVVSVADGAVIRVQNELRFVDGNASQLSLDGGVLQTPVFGLSNASSQHLSLRPVLFNGAVVRAARSNDTWFNLAEASAAPLIRDGGARLDTQGYEVAIRGRGFAQEPGASGPFVKLGSGRLTLAVPMTYTGPTLVSNGTLRLDFALWKGGASAANVLSPQTEVTVSAGAALEVVGQTNAWGEVTQFQEIARLAAADGAMNAMHVDGAALRGNALEESWEKTGGGELALGVGPETVPFTGRLSVLEGAFAVRGVTEAVSAAVPCPGFESEPLLPDDPDKGKMDKRGAAATGCAGWTFVDNDAGYQRNNSYFSTHVDVQTTNGVQTAFVRRNSAMSCSFTLPQAANGCALRFQYAPRYYSNVWFTNALITVKVDGAAVDAFRVVERKFVERTVLPGRLEAGTHTLAFESATENNADVCTLIDDVRIGGVSDIGAAETLSSGESELALAAGTTVALEYAGVFEVGRLVIGGAVQPGGAYGAATRPDVFTGPGLLRVKGGGTRLILR